MPKMTLSNPESRAHGIIFSAVFAAALFVTVWAVSGPMSKPEFFWGRLAWTAFIAAAGFAILKTGKVSPWRAAVFIALAAAFLVRFKLRPQTAAAPYCHIAIASSFLNYLYQQYLALMSGHWKEWGPLTLGALWIFVTLVLGQAWCSWVCFYGGLDEGFSRLLPARWRFLKLRLSGKARDFQTALLIFFLLASLSALTPAFCWWVCPLKMTHAFAAYGTQGQIQIALMWAAGIIFIVLLPIVSGKRSFCGAICPFGAWQAFFGRLNPVRVAPDKDLCLKCGKCEKTCPVFAIESGGGSPEILNYCNRCGSCMDGCPAKAMDYTFLGIRPKLTLGKETLDGRVVFVFCALLIAALVGMIFVPQAACELWLRFL